MPATTTPATDNQTQPAPAAAALGPLPQRASVLAPLGRPPPSTSLHRQPPIPPLPPTAAPAPPAGSQAPAPSTSQQPQPANPTASSLSPPAPSPPPTASTSASPPGARTPATLPDAATSSAAPNPTPPPLAPPPSIPHTPPAPTPPAPSQPPFLDAPKLAPSLEPPAPLDRTSQPALPGAIPGTPKDKPPPPAAAAATTSTPAPSGTHEVAVRVADTPAAASTPPGPGGGATLRGRPQPPPQPPPPHAVQAATEPGQEHRPVEEYIPFGFVELRDKLLSDHPEVFGDPKVALKFKELCKWISARNSLRLQMDYGDAYEKYSWVDPDRDTLAFKVAGREEEQGEGGCCGGCCCGGGCCGGGCCGGGASKQEAVSPAPTSAPSPQMVESSPGLAIRLERVYGEVEHILGRAEFERMPQEDLDKAKNDKSLMGLEVIPASEEVLEFRLYYRGTRTKKIEWHRWGLFKSRIQMNVYERLAITFRLKKPINPEDAPSDPNSYGIDNGPWYRKLFCGRTVSASAPLAALRDEHLHLKLFKDVLQCDADMLLPGAIIKFTWLDYAMIWIPILVGVGCAVWKAMKGTIDFSNLINGVLSVVLIVMPVTWGVRAYFAIKEKQSKHQAHLNALILTHNLTNNGGVIAQLLNEAQEQEDNEAMLAYFFLWLGAESPNPLRKVDLDRAVERYLQNKLDEQGVAVRMDYEVVDALDTLQRMGLVRAVMEPAGAAGAAAAAGEGVSAGSEKRYQALPLDAALEAAHVRHFDESRETGVVQQPRSKTKRYGAISLAWHECQDVFEPTGQSFRYWWNAETGESSYFEPDAPYIKLGTAAAVDAVSAHGQAMQQSPGPGHAKTA